jgi:hypothetical protein
MYAVIIIFLAGNRNIPIRLGGACIVCHVTGRRTSKNTYPEAEQRQKRLVEMGEKHRENEENIGGGVGSKNYAPCGILTLEFSGSIDQVSPFCSSKLCRAL